MKKTSLHCHETEMWFSGPDFLWKHNRHWPEMVAHDDPEIKTNAKTVVAKEAKCFLHYLITCFSSWTKLPYVIAWWLRFKTFCKAKLLHKAGHQPEFPRKDFISCEEINLTSTEVAKLVEKETFEDIRRKLKNHEAFPNTSRFGSSLGKTSPSSLRKLRPIMVCSVIRVGGRLQHADLPKEGKHPFILPPRHHVTALIVRRYHGMGLSAILAFKLSFLEIKSTQAANSSSAKISRINKQRSLYMHFHPWPRSCERNVQQQQR